MTPHTMFLLEFLITGGAAMAWIAWEYWSIRPGHDDKAAESDAASRESPEDTGHPEG